MDFLRRVIAKSHFYCFHLEKDITEKNLSSMTCRPLQSSAPKGIGDGNQILGTIQQTLGIFAQFDFMFKVAQLLS